MAYTEDREIIKTANCGDWVDSFTCLESKNGVDWVKKELQDDY